MVEKYFQGEVPASKSPDKKDSPLIERASKLPSIVDKRIESLDFSGALSEIWALVNMANKYIEDDAPWTLAKQGKMDRIGTFLYNLVEILRIVAILVYPFIPRSAQNMWSQLGYEGKVEEDPFAQTQWAQIKPGQKIKKGKPLFPRVE